MRSNAVVQSATIVVRGLEILCAAHEALTLDELGAVAGWGEEGHRQAFVRGASELLVKTRRANTVPEYRLHHDTIREHIASTLGVAVLRAYHGALARQRATWPPPVDAVTRRYALRHALTHNAEAGDWTEDRRLVTVARSGLLRWFELGFGAGFHIGTGTRRRHRHAPSPQTFPAQEIGTLPRALGARTRVRRVCARIHTHIVICKHSCVRLNIQLEHSCICTFYM